MFIVYILSIYLFLGLLNHFIFELNLFQQSGYKIKKYLKTLPRYYYMHVTSFLRILVLIMTICYLCNGNIFIAILIMFLMLGNVILNKKTILKLKITKRMFRLIFLIMLFQLLILLNPLLIITIELCLIPLIIILLNILLYPIEHLIQKHYIKLAQTKIIY